jgi:hypothetical protein
VMRPGSGAGSPRAPMTPRDELHVATCDLQDAIGDGLRALEPTHRLLADHDRLHAMLVELSDAVWEPATDPAA